MEDEYTEVEKEILQDLISSDIEDNHNDEIESTYMANKTETNDDEMNDSIKKRIDDYVPIQKKTKVGDDINSQPLYCAPTQKRYKRGEDTYECKYCGKLKKGHICSAIIETCDESIQTERAEKLEDKISILPNDQTIAVKSSKEDEKAN